MELENRWQAGVAPENDLNINFWCCSGLALYSCDAPQQKAVCSPTKNMLSSSHRQTTIDAGYPQTMLLRLLHCAVWHQSSRIEMTAVYPLFALSQHTGLLCIPDAV